MIREDILRRFPELVGTRRINARTINVEETIATLAGELGPDIAATLGARGALLQSTATVREKYAWPKWDDTFEDPVTGQFRTFRQIVQGLVDNFLGRESQWRWRLNDEVPIPRDAHPSLKPGLRGFMCGSIRSLWPANPCPASSRLQCFGRSTTTNRSRAPAPASTFTFRRLRRPMKRSSSRSFCRGWRA